MIQTPIVHLLQFISRSISSRSKPTNATKYPSPSLFVAHRSTYQFHAARLLSRIPRRIPCIMPHKSRPRTRSSIINHCPAAFQLLDSCHHSGSALDPSRIPPIFYDWQVRLPVGCETCGSTGHLGVPFLAQLAQLGNGTAASGDKKRR